MTKEEIEFAKLYVKCKTEGINSIDTCYYPGCTNKSINSHILQKNGILSAIASNNHLWEHTIDQFQEGVFKFKKKGLNKIFSFNCYCNEHDTILFKKIEGEKINFEDYESCLLFTLRTVYNEIYRKEVNIGMYHCYLKEKPEKFNNFDFRQHVRQEKLGLQDLKNLENDIWSDYINKTESFIFKSRKLPEIGICLSAFFTYDTTDELNEIFQKTGKHAESTSEIFVNLFPYRENAVMMMAHHKRDSAKVGQYFNSYFEDEIIAQTKITNLMLFNCETWVINDSFYEKNIVGIEDCYSDATHYSLQNTNERKMFELNFYKETFKDDFQKWSNENKHFR
ncbi:hypothetical protein ACTS95_09990 [Empedobacter brevis]